VNQNEGPGIAGLVLAAGLSSRMGTRNKLTTPYHGKALLQHCVEHASASDLSQLLVVTGHEATVVQALVPGGVQTVHNPDFATGMASSLVAGVRALEADRSVDGVLVLLGDMPLVTAEHINALLSRFAAQGPGSIVLAANGGQPGNPVLFARAYFAALCALDGDQGAKSVVQNNRDCAVLVDIGQAAERDFDTPEAFN